MPIFLAAAALLSGDLLSGGWVEETESGVEVDLVAVAGPDGRWRRPDGEPLDPVKVLGGTIIPRDDQVAYRFLLHVKAGEGVTLSPSATKADYVTHSSPVQVNSRPVPQLVVLNAAYDKENVPETVDVSVTVGDGEWRRVAEVGEVHAVASGTSDAGRRVVAILHAEPAGRETVVSGSIALWGGGEPSRLVDEYRIVAFDADGNEVNCPVQKNSGGYLIQMVGKATGAERFVLQQRPRVTVTFKGVRLTAQ